MYVDWLYIALVLPALVFSLWAQSKVNRTFKTFSSVKASSFITADQATRRILDENGLSGVSIGHVQGNLTDHFDPAHSVINLSSSVSGSSSIAAIGVAAHEAGHAIQKSKGYAPYRVRAAIVGVTSFGSKLSLPLIFLGLFLTSFSENFIYLAYAGVALFALVAVFQLVTLPTEFDASRRALRSLESMNILDSSELEGARKVLTAAALTYVAALAVSLMQLLRLFLRVNSRDRRR
ncbi:MAG: zinc metallopeptidase [Sphaerochaetaceae bacterium]|jgi:Zn-dependent membrane protease YugP|nr:zinc metallopeptidase [Sphaerochaetaceae bacterium]